MSLDLELDINGNYLDETKNSSEISIRLQPMGRRKKTIIEGIKEEKQCDVLLKKLKKFLSTGGSIDQENDKEGKLQYIILLQGDKRHETYDFLVNNCGIEKNTIKIHGG